MPKSVDWINTHIKSEYFHLHKKDLLLNNIDIREYETVSEYIKHIEGMEH